MNTYKCTCVHAIYSFYIEVSFRCQATKQMSRWRQKGLLPGLRTLRGTLVLKDLGLHSSSRDRELGKAP